MTEAICGRSSDFASADPGYKFAEAFADRDALTPC
jgi:hypothetical protein